MDTAATVLITVLVCALCWHLGLVSQKKEGWTYPARPQPQTNRCPDDASPPCEIATPGKLLNSPSEPFESTPTDTKAQFSSRNDNVPRVNEGDGTSAIPRQEQARNATTISPQKSLPLSSYTIGWISAIAIELAAAKLMLDEVHTHPSDATSRDTNNYTLGSIHGHNVAIAPLPGGSYGTNSAAVVASNMMRTFPNLRFGLMVGVGGGVPSKAHDIRLGDIVVSKPEGNFGGVIQIDLGKNTPEGFKRTGMLNRPPDLLLATIQTMEADQIFEQPQDLPDLLENIRNRVPQERVEQLTYNPSEDKLYESSYNHPSNTETCESCDEERLVSRIKRSRNDPVIHYGLIASGNLVEKDALNRERLREELKVLCFEMEAAGLMNHFPCIVIRGICDYADSHKNKHYQLYAATVAAAYAKIFLSKIKPKAVEQTTLAKEVCKELLPEIEDRLRPLLNDRQNKEDLKILDWLSISSHRARHKHLSCERKGDTGQWFLDSQEVQEWLKLPKSTLFCPGIPGAGKTFVASRVIDELLSVYTNDRDRVVYVYCEYARQSEQTSNALIASILRQLSDSKVTLPKALSRLARSCSVGQGEERQATYEQLNTTLIEVAQDYRRIFLVIDAIDECSYDTLLELVPSIQDFYQRAPVSLMLTSRHVPEIIELLKWDIRLSIEANKEDIRSYLDKRTHEIRMLRNNPDLSKEAVEGIAEAIDGMFLLARLHFDTLKLAHTPRQVRTALQRFRDAPQGQSKLDEAYRNTIERIEQRDQGCEWAYEILTWIVHVIRPLSPRELQQALAIKPGNDSIDKDDFADPTDIISLCAGLVTINEETDTVQLVHYTTKEFFENNRPGWMLNVHERLSVSCLTYLSCSNFASLGREGALPDTKLAAVIAENAFLPYAARNWGHHVRLCNEGSWKSFDKLLIDYLGRKDLICVANEVQDLKSWRWSHYLASFGLIDVFEYIVENEIGPNLASFEDVDLDAQDEWGVTPLICAAKKGNLDVVKFLVDLGPGQVNVNARAQLDETALHQAARNGYGAIVEILGNLPIDRIDMDVEAPLWTPLMQAINGGHVAVVETFIRIGEGRIDFNHKESLTGLTPLLIAAFNGNIQIIKSLCRLGPEKVDVNASMPHGMTALHMAIGRRRYDIAEFLIGLGKRVDLEVQDGSGRTPRSLAAVAGPDFVKLFPDNTPVTEV